MDPIVVVGQLFAMMQASLLYPGLDVSQAIGAELIAGGALIGAAAIGLIIRGVITRGRRHNK